MKIYIDVYRYFQVSKIFIYICSMFVFVFSREDAFLTLSRLASEIATTKVTRFNINRQTVWDCCTRKLKKKDFNPQYQLLVKFADNFGEMEEGIDQGGPKMEFLSLIMEHILNSSLFEGPSNSKYLSWNKKAFENDDYFYAGLMIALSLVHGGPAPHCFAPTFIDALVKGPSSVQVTIDDLPDEELKRKLEKILCAKTQAARDKAKEKVSTYLTYAGIEFNMCQTAQHAETLVCRAVHSYLFDRTSQAFQRFYKGLETLKVFHNIRSLQEFFVYKEQKFTMEDFEKLFEYHGSEEGSNDRASENLTVAFWRDYLEEVEEGSAGLSFQNILHFATGAKQIPPLGFQPRLSISFWKEKLPKAVTCTNSLYLPCCLKQYDEFKHNMEFAVLNTEGFLLE